MYQIINHKDVKHQLSQDHLETRRLHLFKCFFNFRAFLIILLMPVMMVQTGCKKFVQIETPPDKITQQNVYSTDPTAIGVLTGIYSIMSAVGIGAEMARYNGLLADEWALWPGAGPELRAYYTNFLFSTSTAMNTGNEIWNSYYNFIFSCNSAIEGVMANRSSLTPFVQQQLLGEAYFLRAWFYFYLTNLYGDLPLAVGTDPEINRLLQRSPVQSVYQLMIDDLLHAQNLLSADYVNRQLMPYPIGAMERIRPSKWAATALLARVYLYAGQYAKAEEEANKVLANTAFFGLSPLPAIFLKNSREAIWQLQPVTAEWNTMEARSFHLLAPPAGLGSEKMVYLSQFLLNAFEPQDQRRNMWVDSLVDGSGTFYFPIKYKIGAQNSAVNNPQTITEYSMTLRLAEQYLIRAEARARQNKLPSAIADLDSLRKRAGLPLMAATNPDIAQAPLLEIILHERQVELFTEWGHRWFDLKRFDKADEVMSTVTSAKGGNWEQTDQLLPIPYNDLLFNPKLTQNAGY